MYASDSAVYRSWHLGLHVVLDDNSTLLWAAPAPVAVAPGAPALVFELPAANPRAATALAARLGGADCADWPHASPPPQGRSRSLLSNSGWRWCHGSPRAHSTTLSRQGRGCLGDQCRSTRFQRALIVGGYAEHSISCPPRCPSHRQLSVRVKTFPLTMVIDGDGRVRRRTTDARRVRAGAWGRA